MPYKLSEGELLCNCIAIMFKCRLKYISTIEHLKMKFSNTYILYVPSNDVEKLHSKIVLKGQLFEINALKLKTSLLIALNMKSHFRICGIL